MNLCSRCGASYSGSLHICYQPSGVMGNLVTSNAPGFLQVAATQGVQFLPSMATTATIPQQLIVEADMPRLYSAEQVVALLDRIHPRLSEMDAQTGERALGYSKALYHLSAVIAELKEEIEEKNDPEPGDDDCTDD